MGLGAWIPIIKIKGGGKMKLQKIEILDLTQTKRSTEMYDIEVRDNHNYFLANGVLTHNSINLLKSATETEEKRLLTKSNYSKQQSDLPDRFLFTGKIIFDYNEINGILLEDDFNALQTRGDFLEVTFSIEDIKALMRLIAQNDRQKETTEYLIDNYSFTGTNLLNLRSQWKAFKTREYSDKYGLDWKEELKAEMDSAISPVKSMLYSLMGRKAIRVADLKKLLLQTKTVASESTANRRIKEWLITEDLYRVSAEKINFYVALEPIKLEAMQKYNEQ